MKKIYEDAKMSTARIASYEEIDAVVGEGYEPPIHAEAVDFEDILTKELEKLAELKKAESSPLGMEVLTLEEDVESSLEKLNALMNENHVWLELSRPAALAVKKGDGSGGYATRTFSHGVFRPVSLRPAKTKGEVIVTFIAEDRTVVEIKRDSAKTLLNDFTEWYDGLLEAYEARVLAEAKKSENQVKKEIEQRYAAVGNLEFGSW